MEPCVQEIWAKKGVGQVIGDQCLFGQQSELGEPVANSVKIAACLEPRCRGHGGACSRPAGGRHVPCIGKAARRAAIYHEVLRDAILN